MCAIRLNVKLDHDLVDSISPDAVVLATGGLPDMPQIVMLFDTADEYTYRSQGAQRGDEPW